MKFTFVLPEITRSRLAHYTVAIGALSAALKASGHTTSLLHYVAPVKEKDLVKSILEESPDIVGFSTTTNMFGEVKQMAMSLKRHINIPIICGGVHPTLAPESVIDSFGIDMICVGEGEAALVELCNRMETGGDIMSIPNLWVKKEGEIFRNPPRDLIEDLDSLPFQDRDIFDYENLTETRNRSARIMASRGCPYNCTYCCNFQIKEVYHNKDKYVRFLSVDRILAEIEQLIRTYPYIEYLVFHDDILPLRMDWFRQFAEEYPRRIGLPFRCNCRPDLMNEERAELLRQAGCAKVNFGIESGNEEIRCKILNRNITQDQMVQAFTLCKNKGIVTQSYNMVGLPFETKYSVLETIKLNAQIKPDVVWQTVFYPYPQTELYTLCKKNGFLTEREFHTIREGTVLSQPTISEVETNFAFEFFYLFVQAYIQSQKLPAQLRKKAEKALDFLFTSRIVPHRLLVALKRVSMGMLYDFASLLRQERFAYLYKALMFLRSRKEGRLRAYED